MSGPALNHHPDEPFRVLRVIARMNIGGPAVQIGGLMAALPARGFEGLLLTGLIGDGEEELIQPDIAPYVRRIGSLGRRIRLLGDVAAFVAILRTIRRYRPHIVHTHTAKAGVLGRVAALIGRVPVVVHTYHGHVLHGYFGPLITRAVAWVERRLARRSTALASVGSRVRDDLLAAGIGDPDQFWIVPPGVRVPVSHDRGDARHGFGFDVTDVVVTFVGRLAPIKRFDRFVAMADELVSTLPTVRFLVVGGGDLDGAKALAAAHSTRFTFAGWMRDPGVAYAASDVVVLTSDNEGMPVSLIEAQMCGVPVVTTDVGSAREVVRAGETGYVVEPLPDALAQAVIAVVSGELPTDASARIDWAVGQFSVDRLVDCTVEMYRDGLRRKGLTVV